MPVGVMRPSGASMPNSPASIDVVVCTLIALADHDEEILVTVLLVHRAR